MEKRIIKFIDKVRYRLMSQKIISCLQVSVAVGLAAALIVSIMSLLIPFYYAPHMECGLIVLSVFIGVVWGIVTAPDRKAAALAADSRGNQERISTALELIEEDKSNPYMELQLRDTLSSVQGFSVRKEFPFKLNLRFAALWAVIAVAFAASLFSDSLVRQRANELHAIKAQAADTVAQVEEVEKALNESNEISDSELAEYLEQLENSKTELENASTSEELLKAQERLEQKLKSVAEGTSDTKLSEAADNAASNTQSLASDTRQSLLEQAVEALEQAGNGTDEEKEYAYEKLSELASALGDDTLAQAADNYQSSNYSSSSYAAAKSALSQTAGDLSNNTLASGDSNSSNSSTSSDASVSNNSGSSGDGSDSSSNSGSGTEGNGSDSNGSDGSGTSGSNSSGTNGDSGQGWNYGGSTGNEGDASTDESITVPDGEVGDDGNLTGQVTDTDSSSYAQSDQSYTWSGNKVSYGSVSADYKEKAYAQVESSGYPDSLKEQIKNYFDGLN